MPLTRLTANCTLVVLRAQVVRKCPGQSDSLAGGVPGTLGDEASALPSAVSSAVSIEDKPCLRTTVGRQFLCAGTLKFTSGWCYSASAHELIEGSNAP